MILFLIQLLLIAGSTVWFVLERTYPVGIFGILAIVGFLLGMIIVTTLLFALIVIISLQIGVYTNKKGMFKHKLLTQYGIYVFNVLLRVRVIVTGKENLPVHNRFITVANHIEYTDPIYVKEVFRDYPIAFIFKEELLKSRIMRLLTTGTGCIPLARGMTRQGLEAILQAIDAVRNNQPIGVFPEGTRSHKNEMIPFKAGSFKIALKAKADIVPVCLYNMAGIFRKGRIGIHKCYVHVLPTIKYEQIKDLDTQAISELVQERIESRLEQYRIEQG